MSSKPIKSFPSLNRTAYLLNYNNYNLTNEADHIDDDINERMYLNYRFYKIIKDLY